MNLIEQFGYEAVKSELKNKKWRKDNLHGSAEFTWHIEQHIQLLEAILLQHRRQHNIFEVGDHYVYLYEWDSDLDIVCKFNPSEWGDHSWNIENMIRHATPEEIKAGRRL